MNDPSQMMNRGFGMWPPPPPPPPPAEDPMGFPAQPRPRPPPFAAGNPPGRLNWNGKAADNRLKAAAAVAGGAVGHAGGGIGPLGGAGGGVSGYNPLGLGDHQFQNRAKARRFYPKKKFVRFAPFAPRNTTSFIMRAKKAGGIASLVSPCPVTPAILPTPKFSPTREGLVDMAKEEWGVDGYGSMKGLIRLRSPNGYGVRAGAGEEEDEVDEVSSDSDVDQHLDQHLEVERRLDHDVSRFEMVYPGEEHGSGATAYMLENRVENQDTLIARLEEDNFMLKERVFLMERELGELRRRLQSLETQRHRCKENNKDSSDGNNGDIGNANGSANEEASDNEEAGDVCSDKSANEDCDQSSGNPMRD